jgi:hypothetical protein
MNTARVMTMAFLLGFGAALGIIVAQRMTAESMAVIVGVVAGVAASVPTSVVVAWMAGRMAQRQPPIVQASEPRIVVVPPQPMPGPGSYPMGPASAPIVANLTPRLEAGERRFRVIGGSEVEIDNVDVRSSEESTWQR